MSVKNLEGIRLSFASIFPHAAGPNMAGKSTILRSTMAVALLAACGFYAPVASAAVPYTDAFMLRTFSTDAPSEGRSSFAVEMVEMRCMAKPGQPSCLA